MIQAVNPVKYAAFASEILSAAWKPPALSYTPEYLRWQFGHPTALEPIGLASENAFVAATGRRLMNGIAHDVYLSSHFCVRPSACAGEAVSMIRAEIKLLLESGAACVVFACPDSIGESMLRAWGPAAVRKSLGSYIVHAGVSREKPARLVPFAEWYEAWSCLKPSRANVLLLDPAHYANDPRGCCPAVAYVDGAAVAAALIGNTESVTLSGIQSTPTLYCLRANSGEGVKALIAAAGGMALVPNVRLVAPEVVKAAGLRQTPSRFNGFIFCPSTSHPLAVIDAVETEPV